MRILIIEDEKLASDQLMKYLKEISNDHEILEIIETVEDGISWLNENEEPDCILSDIKLPDGLSFEIFNKVNINCPVIFTTAYDQYAIKAFELNSLGYLLKPYDKDQLTKCLEKVKTQHHQLPALDLQKLASLISQENQTYKSRFLVRVGQKIKAVSVDKISYFMSHDKLTYIVTRNNEKLPIDQSLEELESLLDPNDFFRMNRKFITHFEGIKEIHPYFKGRLKVILAPPAQDDIIISAEKTPAFKAWLDK